MNCKINLIGKPFQLTKEVASDSIQFNSQKFIIISLLCI